MIEREQILNEVLALSPVDKAYIFHVLEASLMESADEQAFVAELHKRMEAYRRDPQSAKPVAQFMQELRSSFDT